jgi:hypothetical protein
LNTELLEIYNVFYDEDKDGLNDKILELNDILDSKDKYETLYTIDTNNSKRLEELNKMINNKINCQYCNKLIYKTHKKRHQNSNQCKNHQSYLDIIKQEIIEFKCKHCDKSFNRKDDKNTHEYNVSCDAKIILFKMEKKDKEIELYKEQIKRLDEENKLMIMNLKPNNSINNSINNSNIETKITCKFVYVNIKLPEDLIAVLPKLTIEDHKQGGHGFGSFIMKHVAAGKILINDSSRMIMSYMLNGVIVKDDGTNIILECLNVFNEEQRRLINTGLGKNIVTMSVMLYYLLCYM